MNNIIFNNLSLYNLWDCEISGQLSDGAWENRPGANKWSRLLPKYDPSIKLSRIETDTPETYRRPVAIHKNKSLLDAVADRMKCYIACGMLGMKINRAAESSLERMWIEIDNESDDAKIVAKLRELDKKNGRAYDGFDNLFKYANMNPADAAAFCAKLRDLKPTVTDAMLKNCLTEIYNAMKRVI